MRVNSKYFFLELCDDIRIAFTYDNTDSGFLPDITLAPSTILSIGVNYGCPVPHGHSQEGCPDQHRSQ